MKTLRFECPIENFPGFRADAVLGDTVFEVIVESKDARRLRTALIEMARVATADNVRRVILVLEEPTITESRLHAEWKGAASVIRPEIFARLSLAIHQSGKWTGIPVPPAPDELSVLEEILQHEISRRPISASRSSEAHHEILRILVHQWLLGKGPIAVNSLMEISGTSHPTVARALERFDHYLKRHSDRSVELRIFPREDWARLLAVSDDVRGTVKRSTSPGGPFTIVASVSVPVYSDSSVLAGTTYYYVVSSVNTFGESTNSSPAAALACLRPTSPTGLTAVASGSQLTLNWSPSPDATTYSLARATSGTPYSYLAINFSTTSYTDTDLVAGVVYYYAVAAANDCNQGPASPALAAALPPPLPTGLAAQPGNRQVLLSWDVPPSPLVFNVKRSARQAGPYALVAANVTGTSYLDAGLTNGVTCYYEVECRAGRRRESGLRSNCGHALRAAACPRDGPTGHWQPWPCRECLILRGWVYPAGGRGGHGALPTRSTSRALMVSGTES